MGWGSFIRSACFFLIAGFSCYDFYAQINPSKGELFTALNGLTQTHVTAVYQDSLGFLWVGTQDGLNKYDGYSFQHYRNQMHDSNSISNNYISSIAEDSDGNLWIGTNRGLNRLDRKTGTFSVYLPPESEIPGLGEPIVYSVCIDRTDNVWFKTGNFLEVLKPDSGVIRSYRFYNDPYNQTNGSAVSRIFVDRKGQIWLSTKDGLNLFIPGSHEFKRFIHDPSDENSISNSSVRTIYEDSRNILWIGTEEGLNIYNPSQSTFLRIPLSGSTGGRDQRINTISEDSRGKIWVGTDMGFYIMTPDGEIHGKYTDIETVNRKIQISSIYSILEDRSEIIWMGTYEGLVKMDQKKKKFDILENSVNGFPRLSSNNIFSVYEDDEGRLWLGTWGYGLNIIDYKNKQVDLYSRNAFSPDRRIVNDYVLSIYEDNEDRIWIGTSNGINYFDTKNGHIYPFCQDNNDQACNIFRNNNVYAILEDFKGNIWFATADGICQFIETNDEIRTYKISSVYCLAEDPDGKIWAGSEEGLLLYNPVEDVFRDLSSQTVYSLYLDSHSILWIGTSSGLNRYNRAEENFTSFPGSMGLMVNQVLGILEDQDNCLWLSTNRGLLKFDPVKEEYSTFNLSDGLQNYEFNRGAAFKSASGKLFFGGISGLNYFYPDSISFNENIPPVSFTYFEIAGEWGRSFLPLERTLSVEVMKGNRTFTIGFAALDFTAPENNRYRYKMVKQGSSGTWINFGNQHNVTFYNLSPGSYVISVKGSNNDNVWNHREVSLNVTVPPPFWNSWKAYIIYGIISVLMIYLLIQIRTRNLRQSNKMLKEKEVAAREIDKQREELMVKNRSIMDSIIYAQRIQMALLPSNEIFKKVFPNSFILYKPKDIVSGDFYWINTDKEKIYVAAVDCTGHGVPGAFVSIIGFELFRKITSAEGIKNPAQILASLNSNFTEIFSDGHQVYLNDGMDLSLCVLDRNEKSLEYSGAFNPLYIIRDETIIEIKANRFSVGADVRLARGELNFKSHKVALEKDDILYLFSDGYSDQFGGPEGKKFKYRRFRHLLLTIHKIPMERQLAILDASIEEWKGDYEQVDDIMVIGIRPDFWKTGLST